MNIDLNEMEQNAVHAEGMLKLLANRNRLMILCRLQQEEMSVSELNDTVPLTQSALSQHLASLRKAGIVATRRDGQTIYYRVVEPKVSALLNQLYQLFCQ